MYEFHFIKQGGKRRKICKPLPETKVRLEALLPQLNAVELHDAAHGFRAGRDCVSNAKVHVGERRDILTLDIKSWFPSCKKQYVMSALPDSVDHEAISNNCFWQGVLPTGACTSPVLSNILMVPLDAAITEFIEGLGFKYTRYADDLAFSGVGLRDQVDAIESFVTSTLGTIELRLKRSKTKLMRYHSSQAITGICVSHGLIRLSRAKRNSYWEHFQQVSLPLSEQDAGVLSYIRSVDLKFHQRLLRSLSQE